MLQEHTRRPRQTDNTPMAANSKNKLIGLLKRIAELELREARYIEKIRYLEASNLRLATEQHQQLELMKSHPTHEIEAVIRSLQNEVKRLSVVTVDREKDIWIKKYEDVVDKSNKALKTEEEKRLLLEFELNTKRQSQSSYNLKAQNERLHEELEGMLIRNQEVEAEYSRLQGEIEGKFQILDQQISLYQQEREESGHKINRLQEELRLREACDGFSFSNTKDLMTVETQTEQQSESMDMSCYKSSIESLLQENTRLKRSIVNLQSLVSQAGGQVSKEVEIELRLSRHLTS